METKEPSEDAANFQASVSDVMQVPTFPGTLREYADGVSDNKDMA